MPSKKEISRKELLDLLEVVDKEFDRPIDITAVGGTAMTLLYLKSSTIDVDFDFRSDDDRKRFEKVLKGIPHGFRIDRFCGGFIFFQQLPADYFEKSISIPHRFRSIRLYALHPLDIVVSKIGRLDERDVEDIESCIKEYKLEKSQVKKRAKSVRYAGHEENYGINLQYVLRMLNKP
ncbi:hypothetical protein H0N98_02325 [Candidatus Micrarchaeota archaeon]|nr:hypothetical protein [Candidatus Micrarchaeota archaeon]